MYVSQCDGADNGQKIKLSLEQQRVDKVAENQIFVS